MGVPPDLGLLARYVEQRSANKKRILRLMRAQQLLVTPSLRLKAKRTPTGSTPRPTQPNEWCGIDMTKVLLESCGGVSIVIMLDRYTKKIVGYDSGTPCTARHWLTALDMAVQGQFPDGVRGQDVPLMSDKRCQPTSKACMEAFHVLGIPQALTSDDNREGHADTERVMRTVKEGCLGLQEWTYPFAVASALDISITYYNEHYLHSSLGYKPSRQFEKEYHSSHSTPFVAA